MRSSSRSAAVAGALILLPLLTVFGLRKAGIGPSISSPLSRQKGPQDAKVVIVEFSDFQCPVCARVQPSVTELFNAYQGKVRLVFKHFPLQGIHPNALSAARAAECASEQKMFWEYADALYQKQPLWATLQTPTTMYYQFAQDSKMNVEAFQECFTNDRSLKRVMADIHEGQAMGLNSTPTFYVGKEQIVGTVFITDGARAIEKALRQ